MILYSFSGHYLLFLARVETGADFDALCAACEKYLFWADLNLTPPYEDGYYQLEQINNQLTNSKRALQKSNIQLKQRLIEIQEANDTIALLEHDELTGLYRASSFYQYCRKFCEQNPDCAFDVFVLDLDNFKLVNEFFSRRTGDLLLHNFALFLTGMEHMEKGILARAFSDTFYLMLPREFASAEILQQNLCSFFATYPLPLHLSAKIGVCPSTPDTAVSIEEMCDRARLALDAVRNVEGTAVSYYNPAMHEDLVWQHQIIESLPAALANHEFQLYLQPKVSMRTGRQIGAEALIRWIHPTLGFIPPDRFIPLLEQENLIYEVDLYIWEETCRFLKERKDRRLPSFPVSVNMARADLYKPDLADRLLQLLEKYDLSVDDLHLEIIERAYVNDSATIFTVLTKLRSLGFLIEMDDFGTGESSLSMVADMPIDVIKLDRSFLVSCLHSKRHSEVIRFIIRLAESLQMEVIAEGVETKEQEDFLLSVGCTYAQGYFYGKPAPADSFLF